MFVCIGVRREVPCAPIYSEEPRGQWASQHVFYLHFEPVEAPAHCHATKSSQWSESHQPSTNGVKAIKTSNQWDESHSPCNLHKLQTLFKGLHYLIPTISHLKAFGQTVHKLRFKTRIFAAAELCRQSTQPSLLFDKPSQSCSLPILPFNLNWKASQGHAKP